LCGEENKNVLSGFQDLVGDDLIPTKQFFFNMKYLGGLLNENPEKTLNKLGIKLRSMTTARLVRLLAQNFMTSKQVFEDRNELMAFAKLKTNLEQQGIIGVTPDLSKEEYDKDLGIKLPKEPVIWAMNHHFKDDALASVRAAQRPVTLMFGSVPLYFNTLFFLLKIHIKSSLGYLHCCTG